MEFGYDDVGFRVWGLSFGVYLGHNVQGLHGIVGGRFFASWGMS